MRSAIRSNFEHSKNAIAFGLGGAMLLSVARGFFDRREHAKRNADLQRHLAEMAFEKDVELALPVGTDLVTPEYADWDADEVLDSELIHEGQHDS